MLSSDFMSKFLSFISLNHSESVSNDIIIVIVVVWNSFQFKTIFKTILLKFRDIIS